jgi:hypothetical protein
MTTPPKNRERERDAPTTPIIQGIFLFGTLLSDRVCAAQLNY